MATLRSADQEQLQKLLLGQLPSAEVERLATEYADDSRLAELAESLAGNDDALLHLLHNHETAVVDPEGERLVERLVQRLKPALPVSPRDDTAAMNRADVSTEPSSPAAKGQPQKLPERLEYYRPIKVLGQGGMGTVYLAEDTRLGREVAIKTLRPELAINPQAKERFLREARSAAKLEHDHIIPIYSVGEAADGTPFLAMPFLKGEPLDALIRQTGGPLRVATAVRLAREIASGLAAAHARGLIHRDIKPANIWLEAPTGRVKILDFGLAKAADAGSEADSETNLTASGAIVGTPAYMAPEQASGHAVDGRADLFSLGCVLYELLSGKRAFSGPNTMSILMSLANHTPPAPDKLSPQCPAALSRLVMQLLAKDPAKRPASAEAVIQALDELEVAAGGWALLPVIPNATGKSAHPPKPTLSESPGSPTRIDQTRSDSDVPSDGTILLSLVTPARKPSSRKTRVALALAGALLTLLAAVVYRIETDKGTVVVEIHDDDVEARLKSNGIEIRDSKSGRVFTIRKIGDLREASGDYKLADGKGLKFVVLDADGLEVQTNEFKLVSGDKVRVLVTAETNDAASATSPQSLASDRRAAEWVLSIGGKVTVRVNEEERPIVEVAHLPQQAFELVVVNLGQNQKLNDAGLTHLQNCKHLRNLDLGTTPVTDAGMVNLKDFETLASINLENTQVGDAGVANLKNCRNLDGLVLGSTRVTDVGLSHFRNCKKITQLTLTGTKTSDEGLMHFKDCDMYILHLQHTRVSDIGLACFKDCKNVESLALGGTKISDEGLAYFKDCKNLSILDLHITSVSDLGLERLANYSKLSHVYVIKTKVTEAGVKKLSAALPGCKIEWDGGAIEPTMSPDRRAAEYVLSINGTVNVKQNLQDRQVEAVHALPQGPFELTGVVMRHNTKVSDAGLAIFKDCTNITSLALDASIHFTDAGLLNFKGCKNITNLVLAHTQVSDAGLAIFQGCQNVTTLSLSETQVSDAGLAYFKKCRNLAFLDLHNSHVSDAGLAHFNECKSLTHLNLSDTRVSDAGLAHFKDCQNLTILYLFGTTVSDVGMGYFKDCKNLALLGLNGTQVSDAGLVHFKDCENLTTLDLRGTTVSDAGLTYFKNRKNFTFLYLGNTKVSDAGLVHFKDCKNLLSLELSATQVSDAGLAHFKDCGELMHLLLTGTQVTDAGLEPLANCPKLLTVIVTKTKVTEAGVKKLSAALPGCKIEWDGGVIEPTVSPDRKAAEYVLSIGGTVRIKEAGQERAIEVVGDLPRGPFELTVLSLNGNPKTSDAGLANCQGCKNLTYLNLDGTQVSDAGLAHFKDCKKLTHLGLHGTKVSDAGLALFKGSKGLTHFDVGGCAAVSDAGLANFKDCKDLVYLDLAYAELSDAGLTYFKDCKDLTTIFLGGPQVTDAGLANFKDCKDLKALALGHTQVSDAGLAHFKDFDIYALQLVGTQVSDAGLVHLHGFKHLAGLDLRGMKVTADGVKKLSAALPGCKIEWDGGVIEPMASTDSNR